MSDEEKTRRPRKRSEKSKDHNEARREAYSDDIVYRQKAKKWSRQSYRRKNPKKPSQLSEGLLSDGVTKEVVIPNSDGRLANSEVFTISQAAVSLGKNRLTVRRWIQNGIVPDPIVEDTSHGYRHYTRAEMEIVARIVATHEKEYDYIHSTHTVTINNIWQQIEAYRKKKFR